ncbi:MAG: PAS domain S-box protein [Gemmatimonadetes bacterium]|nr:PAS domain S-box protein [Gemmatimonadota bacterium]
MSNGARERGPSRGALAREEPAGPASDLDEARAEIERLARENRELRGQQARLRFRRQELSDALRMKHEEFLDMLGRLQEREETAVQRALQELTRSEERFRLVVESVQDYAIFLLDREGRITSANQGAEAILGSDRDKLPGERLSLFLTEEDRAADLHLRLLEEALEKGEARDEGWRIGRDGARIWASETVTVIRDETGEVRGFVDITRDLTERMRSQRALEETAGELRSTVGKLEERTAEAEEARRTAEDAQARTAFLSDASGALASLLDFDHILGTVARLAIPILADWVAVDVVQEEEREGHQEIQRRVVVHRDPALTDAAEALRQGGPGGDVLEAGPVIESGEARLIAHVDPSEIRSRARSPAEAELLERMGTRSAMVVPLIARGEPMGVVTLAVGEGRPGYGPADLALARELAHRGATAADNARLYSSAVVASRAKSEFLGVMSHELRTPLNAILGYVDLLDIGVSGDLADEQRAQLGRVKASAHHLLHLIEGILTYSRLEAGKEEIATERVALDELIGDVVKMLEPQARKAGLELGVQGADGGSVVETDPNKLRQVLINLLSNAVKFTEAGSIEVRWSVDAGWAEVAVEDTGIGIEASDLQRIFEPYWQVTGDRNRVREGTGLGLSVSRELVSLLGGRIDVESEVGVGTTFTVRLPLSPPGSKP